MSTARTTRSRFPAPARSRFAGRPTPSLRARLPAALLFAVGIATAPAAQAQMQYLAESPALKCLTPPEGERGVPDYPADSVRRGDAGVATVELTFEAPDAAPRVDMRNENLGEDLKLSVLRFVRKLRLPCMTPGEPVRLIQEYRFVPGDGRPVVALPPRDPEALERKKLLSCVTRIVPGLRPDYPLLAQIDGAQGKVLVRLTYRSPTEAPELEFIGGTRNVGLQGAVRDFVAGYRAPCLGAMPLRTIVLFAFSLDGGERTRLRDSGLLQLLRSARSFPRPVSFDTQAMGCPFDLRFGYFRPFASNSVGQLGEARPERQPLVEWLEKLELAVTERTADALIGETMTLTIPCAKIDL